MGGVCSAKSKNKAKTDHHQDSQNPPINVNNQTNKMSPNGQNIQKSPRIHLDEQKKVSGASATLEQICASKEDIKQIYDYEKTIGYGTFGKVYLATRKQDPFQEAIKNKRNYAIKAVKRKKVGEAFSFFELRELNILQKLDHPNIVKLYEIYQDEEFFYFVLEYCSGGELLEYFLSKNARLDELETMKIMTDIFKAIAYLHENKISHRDIKLENFLFEHTGSDAHIKLIDFGLSKQSVEVLEVAEFKTIVGSPNFIAPEILSRQGYDCKCDMWSLGVIIFILLSGDIPFQGQNNRETFINIKKGKYEFKNPEWGKITEEGKDLIKKLLVLDPKKRLSSQEALKHPWFQMKSNKHEHEKNSYFDAKLFKILKNLKPPGKFKKEVMKVMLEIFKNDEDHKKMTQIFKKLDTLNNGVITVLEIENALSEAILNKDNETKNCLNELMKFTKNNSESLTLTYTDFLMATLDKNKLDKKKWIAAFKHFDIDNSGIVTTENIKQAMERAGKNYTEEEIKEMIKEFEAEKHGGISLKQFMKFIEKDGYTGIGDSREHLPDPIDLNGTIESISSEENVFVPNQKEKHQIPEERSNHNIFLGNK